LKIVKLGWLFAAVAVAGCNGGSGSSGTAASSTGGGATGGKQLTVGIVFDAGGRGDKSFNDSAYAGIERAKKEFNIVDRPVDSKSEKDYEANLSALADEGADLVLAVGITMKNALETVAPKYPNIKFASVDAVIEQPNVRSLVFSEEQGSFLAGYAAALASKTKKIGFVGGMNIPLIKKFETGYAAGAKMADPSVQLLPAKYTESWDDTSTGKAAADVLFDSGADVVYHAAGRCGLGVIQAAKENNKLAIGVDSNQDDQAPGFVLTSMVKRVDEAVYSTIKDIKEGKFAGGTKAYDLKANGVGLTDFKNTKDKIGTDNLAKIEAVAERIKSGELSIPTKPEELAAFVAANAAKR
jgi:basic membrane protein A